MAIQSGFPAKGACLSVLFRNEFLIFFPSSPIGNVMLLTACCLCKIFNAPALSAFGGARCFAICFMAISGSACESASFLNVSTFLLASISFNLAGYKISLCFFSFNSSPGFVRNL